MQRSTVNIKKLIAESDFGDVQELSKRWVRAGEASRLTEQPDFKENSDYSNISSQVPTRQKQKELKQTKSLRETKQFKQIKSRTDLLVDTDYKKVLEKEKKPHHNLQYMDEDTEHFKVRLEHLLNVFKTDAVSQFMSMKRSMLDDQKQQVRSDTQKYLRLYEQKHKQLIETRELLNSKSKQCQNLGIRCQRMARKIYEQKLRTQTFKCLSGPFMQLVQYKDYKQQKHKKQAIAQKFRQKNLIRKAMISWRENNKKCQKQKQQKHLEVELEEVANKYQKQIQMLRQKLADVNSKNDDYERNKNQLQDNLKKAFMRGVCAMNFEAMNALNGQGIPINDPLLQSQSFSQPSVQHQSTPNLNESHVRTEMSFGAAGMNSTLPNNMSSPDFGSKSVVFYKHPKIQSKDHNWKDAPILNIQKQYREPIEDIQPINVIPECISQQQQGKVIKVVNGKSSLVGPTAQSGKKIVGNKTVTTQKKF